MILLQFKNLTIEIFDDSTYSYGSTDNKFNYLKHYFGDGGEEYPVSKHAVKIFDNDKEINSCIVIGSAGATGIHKNSALIDNDKLIICCRDTIFCLTLAELNLHWQTKMDNATSFQVFKLENDYLVHGELEISRVDNERKIKWQFGGADIFVTIEGQEEFEFNTDHLMLTDFCNTKYKIDFTENYCGRHISRHKAAGNTGFMQVGLTL